MCYKVYITNDNDIVPHIDHLDSGNLVFHRYHGRQPQCIISHAIAHAITFPCHHRTVLTLV